MRRIGVWLRWAGSDRGAAAVLTALALPVFLLAMGIVVDAGQFIWARTVGQSAADLAALAAVQEIDLDALSVGERRIIEGLARTRGREVALDNLSRAGPVFDVESAAVEVVVYNVPKGEHLPHPGDQRRLNDPTVCVHVTLTPRFLFINLLEQTVVRAHADASVVERRR